MTRSSWAAGLVLAALLGGCEGDDESPVAFVDGGDAAVGAAGDTEAIAGLFDAPRIRYWVRSPEALRGVPFSCSVHGTGGDGYGRVEVDWGDGSAHSFENWYAPGHEVWLYHTWMNPGSYVLRVRALYSYGDSWVISGWTQCIINVQPFRPTRPKPEYSPEDSGDPM